jgi:hypothetical protein
MVNFAGVAEYGNACITSVTNGACIAGVVDTGDVSIKPVPVQ